MVRRPLDCLGLPFCLAVAALLVLVSGSRLTSAPSTVSAWALVFIGALWTLTTAITEVTVLADLAGTGDLSQFEAWWSFAQGYGNGFSILAVAVAVIAFNESRHPQPLVPKWSAALGAVAGIASASGWVLGVWLDIGPANLMFVLASAVMCVWLAWLGAALVRTAGTPAQERASSSRAPTA